MRVKWDCGWHMKSQNLTNYKVSLRYLYYCVRSYLWIPVRTRGPQLLSKFTGKYIFFFDQFFSFFFLFYFIFGSRKQFWQFFDNTLTIFWKFYIFHDWHWNLIKNTSENIKIMIISMKKSLILINNLKKNRLAAGPLPGDSLSGERSPTAHCVGVKWRRKNM